MKKARVTEVPLPGLAPKSPCKSSQKAAKSQLSEEFVVSSEEESRKKLQGKKSNTKKRANLKSQNTMAAPVTKVNGTPSAKRTPSESASECDSESDSNSDSEKLEEHSTTDKPMKNSNNTARGGEAESAESASGSNSEEDGSGSGSSSEEDSGSEESESEELDIGVREKTGAKQSASSQLQTVEFRTPPPFEPPSEFKAVSGHPALSSNVSKLFDRSTLSGKQIWHITAPAGIPITSIKEVTLEKITRGEAILNHKGLDYGFNTSKNEDQDITKVLVPSAGGYTAAPSPISQTLTLQQVVHLPNLTKAQANSAPGSAAAASSNTNLGKPVRQQPKGLRMRFLPSGFGDGDPGTLGSSDSEASAPTRPEFRMPDGHTHRTEKRNHEEVNGINQVSSSPVKKSKKTKDQDDLKKKMEKKARKREKEISKIKMKP